MRIIAVAKISSATSNKTSRYFVRAEARCLQHTRPPAICRQFIYTHTSNCANKREGHISYGLG